MNCCNETVRDLKGLISRLRSGYDVGEQGVEKVIWDVKDKLVDRRMGKLERKIRGMGSSNMEGMGKKDKRIAIYENKIKLMEQ